MDLATLIPIAVQTSIALTVFGLGLRAGPHHAFYLLRRPAALVRALAAMFVIMPLFAAAMAAVLDFRTPLELVLVALSVSPVPPLLPHKGLKAGGGTFYTIGLLVAAALFAIVFIPAAVALIALAFGRQAHVSAGAVAWLVLISIIGPLAVGMAVRLAARPVAERIANPVELAAMVLLVVSALPIVVIRFPDIVAMLGDGTIVAIVAFTLVGLAVGHVLGGPDPDDRTVLALSTATRHPGIALAIVSANIAAPHILGAILLYLIVAGVASLPYYLWRRRLSHGAHMADAHDAAPRGSRGNG